MEQNGQMQEPVGAPHINVQLPPEQERKQGLAIASLILGIIGLFGFCCCGLNLIAAVIAVIMGIAVLVKKLDGTGFAITGIVTGGLALLMVFAVLFSFRDLYPYSETIVRDYGQLVEEQDEVFPKYEADGTLPDYLLKYTETPFTEFFEKYDANFYDVMDVLLEEYKAGGLKPIGYTLPDEKPALSDDEQLEDDD